MHPRDLITSRRPDGRQASQRSREQVLRSPGTPSVLLDDKGRRLNHSLHKLSINCLLYTSDAADE